MADPRTCAVETGNLDSLVASKLVAQCRSDPYRKALNLFPVEIIATRDPRRNLVWVAGRDGCANVGMVQTSSSSSLPVVLVDDPAIIMPSIHCLATELWRHAGEATKDMSGYEPHISSLVGALRYCCSHRQVEMAPARAIEKRMCWKASSARSVSSGPGACGCAARAQLPAGATADVPKLDADFEAVARIECQNKLGNDPSMTRRGLTERVVEAREWAGRKWAGIGLVVTRAPCGVVCAAIWTTHETGTAIELQQVGTLPSHHGRGYAAGLLD